MWEMNLSEILQVNSQRFPSKDAFCFGDESVTWEGLDRATSNVARGLISLGVHEGDRVNILLANSLDFVISYWAVIRAGAVVSPISTMYKRAELSYVLRNAASMVLITAPEFLELVQEVWTEVPHLREVVVVGGEAPPGTVSFENLMADDGPNVMVDRRPDDLCAVHYTSGTTGRAKGVMITHQNWSVGMMDWHVKAWELTDIDQHLVVLPLFHTFGLMMTLVAVGSGATTRLLPKWDSLEVARRIKDEAITVFSGVPTMYVYLARDIDLEKRDLRSLRLAVVGGAPIPLEVQREFVSRTGVTIVDWYGGTGWASTTSPLWESGGIQRWGSLGKKLPFREMEMQVVDEAGVRVSEGVVGELIVRGPSIPPGFWRLPYRTARDYRNGWFHTGDLVRQDDDGYWFLIERKDDLIITAGYNVYPREVEEVLYGMPAIYEVAVIGVPDSVKGQVVKAVVVLRTGESLTEDQLVDHCRQHLANFKVPRRVEFVDALPKSPNGKIIRRALWESSSSPDSKES